MAHPSKRKGDRFEWLVRDIFNDAGHPYCRLCQAPQSAGSPGDGLLCRCGACKEFPKDLGECGQVWTVEQKARADGFKQLYKWLEHSEAVVIKADRKEPLIVLRLRDFV
jgi:hypothetical protein